MGNEHPYRQAGEVDLTAVEVEKQRQAGETARVKLKEREETKRQTCPSASVRVGYNFVAAFLGACAMASALWGWVAYHNARVAMVEAAAPKPCVPTTKIMTLTSDVRACQGGWVETEKLSSAEIVWHCRCAGSPPPAPSGTK